MTAPPAAHRRSAAEAAQRAFIVFGGGADLPWLLPLRRGFRHCFAALEVKGIGSGALPVPAEGAEGLAFPGGVA